MLVAFPRDDEDSTFTFSLALRDEEASDSSSLLSAAPDVFAAPLDDVLKLLLLLRPLLPLPLRLFTLTSSSSDMVKMVITRSRRIG